VVMQLLSRLQIEELVRRVGFTGADADTAVAIGATNAFGGNLMGGNAPQPGATTGVDGLMNAIAAAEGSLEAHPEWNNPGDLTDSFGFANSGPQNADGVLAFATIDDGWGALRAQINLIARGTSRVYTTSMSLLEMGLHWATASGGEAWANNVAAYLGADPEGTTIGQVLNG
jgi:hypothetical protein